MWDPQPRIRGGELGHVITRVGTAGQPFGKRSKWTHTSLSINPKGTASLKVRSKPTSAPEKNESIHHDGPYCVSRAKSIRRIIDNSDYILKNPP